MVRYTECHYAVCRYAECHYAECRSAVLSVCPFMLSAAKGPFMLSVERLGSCE